MVAKYKFLLFANVQKFTVFCAFAFKLEKSANMTPKFFFPKKSIWV